MERDGEGRRIGRTTDNYRHGEKIIYEIERGRRKAMKRKEEENSERNVRNESKANEGKFSVSLENGFPSIKQDKISLYANITVFFTCETM
jgi:hypothetical protein